MQALLKYFWFSGPSKPLAASDQLAVSAREQPEGRVGLVEHPVPEGHDLALQYKTLRTKQLKQKQLQKELLARYIAAAGAQPALSRQLEKEYLAALKVDAKLADELWASELQLEEHEDHCRLQERMAAEGRSSALHDMNTAGPKALGSQED